MLHVKKEKEKRLDADTQNTKSGTGIHGWQRHGRASYHHEIRHLFLPKKKLSDAGFKLKHKRILQASFYFHCVGMQWLDQTQAHRHTRIPTVCPETGNPKYRLVIHFRSLEYGLAKMPKKFIHRLPDVLNSEMSLMSPSCFHIPLRSVPGIQFS